MQAGVQGSGSARETSKQQKQQKQQQQQQLQQQQQNHLNISAAASRETTETSTSVPKGKPLAFAVTRKFFSCFEMPLHVCEIVHCT
jgi:hypothetical protein